MFRYYITPEIGGGPPISEFVPDNLRPKYFGNMEGIAYTSMKFGHEPFCLVYSDLSTFDHNSVAANPDVIVLPANIDQNVGAGALNTIKSNLEACSIPAGWVTAGMTYRQVLRMVCQIVQIYQRLRGLGLSRLLTGGINLDTQFIDLPTQAKQKLMDASDSFGFDRSGMTNTATIRQILKALANQWPGPISCGVQI